MTDPKIIEKANIGRRAQLIIDNLQPFINECRESILSRMKNEYRAGDISKLPSHVAGLCAYDDLEVKLKSKISIGNHAFKEIHNGN